MSAHLPGTLGCIVAGVIALQACAPREGTPVAALDLLKLAGRAEHRPAGGAFPIVEQTCGGSPLPSQEVPVPSRMIHRITFPARARLEASLAVEGPADVRVEFRVGISDGRVYETLKTIEVGSAACRDGWMDVVIDLSRYAGRQWSLFYRPDERSWELILGARATGGSATRAWWGVPRVVTDTRAAREYLQRRR